MDFLTHLVFGALLYNFIFKALPFQYIHYAVFFAILPDLDVFIAPLKRIFKSNYLEHRSGSHSYVIGILISAILSGLFSIFTRQPFYVLWLIGVFFYGLHVSLDLLTTTKIPCFFPLSRKEYCFYVEKAGSSFTLFISLFFIIILSLFFLYVPKFALILVIIDLFTYFFFFYYSFRIAQKFWVNANLNENQKYFPGVLPFYYFIFEKELT
ncbi:MAG: metal-dependent hydrolase, partial [Promethearchaeia archaeon]